MKYAKDRTYLMTSRAITEHLQHLADPQTADQSRRFFKTAKGQYGYGDIFLGIKVPVVRQVVKKYKNVPSGVAVELLKSAFHEVRLFALLLMVERFSQGSTREREEIYHAYLAHTRYVNNWDLVDSSAYHIVGAYLENRDTLVLDELARSDSLWERRIAIIATFHFIRKSRFGETLRIAEQLLARPGGSDPQGRGLDAARGREARLKCGGSFFTAILSEHAANHAPVCH